MALDNLYSCHKHNKLLLGSFVEKKTLKTQYLFNMYFYTRVLKITQIYQQNYANFSSFHFDLIVLFQNTDKVS
jgi:hypothetical protein